MTLDFQDFLRWEETDYDTIKVKRMYIDIAGDLVAGVLLSQIIYWYLPSKRDGSSKLRVKKDGDLWLVKGREDWWDECRITARQFDRAINILIDKGIVEKKIFRFNGSPMVHVRLVPDVLMEYINSELDNSQREIDFNQNVKSNLMKGENGYSQNVKNDFNESVKTITETTTETTTKITTDDIVPSNDGDHFSNSNNNRVPYKRIVGVYNDICVSLPKVRVLSDKRKRVLRSTFNNVGDLEKFKEVFKKAEASDFLSGRNGRWNGCNFDWLINYNNFIKVIEGTYDNKDETHGRDDDGGDDQNKYGW